MATNISLPQSFPPDLGQRSGSTVPRLRCSGVWRFLVSGLICYLLTRYLTAPILRLREASQQLAAGDLSIRAVGVERRRDELGDLVRDFNAMASRIEELVSRQRQLISDVSHELRSPLARLNVALDLGRERKGNDPAFDQMEQDISVLSEMIGRLLTIARLDTSAPPVPMMPVDLTELVSQIVRDADFESRERDGCVTLRANGQVFVQGDAELLHSAIENLVRNAIRYTEPGTPVEVVLESEPRSTTSFARLTVRDHGPGVPESELVNIFQPFYRVADARDRQSGGAGLGLAIADRVIRMHGGTIRAKNAVPRGLLVEILLPDLSLNPQDPSLRHETGDRLIILTAEALFGSRSWSWIAGQHLRTCRGVVDEPRLEGSTLHYISHLNAVVEVHIGMMSSAGVLQRILHETVSVKADPTEGSGIGSAGLASGRSGCSDDCGDLEILHRGDPLLEDRFSQKIAVSGDAAKATTTGIVIEVSIELGELRRLLHRIARGEVMLHIELRSEQSLFLSTPERDANGAVHRLVQRCENADGFDGDRRAGAVVGRARFRPARSRDGHPASPPHPFS